MPAGWTTFGHPGAVRLLSRSEKLGRLAHAYLIIGPEQVGKRQPADAQSTRLQKAPTTQPVAVPNVVTFESQHNEALIGALLLVPHPPALAARTARYDLIECADEPRIASAAGGAAANGVGDRIGGIEDGCSDRPDSPIRALSASAGLDR